MSVLSEQSKIDFFISATKPQIGEFLMNLLAQAHPSVATAELTYDAACPIRKES